MALTLDPKTPTGVVRYTWTPPVLAGDTVASATLVRTSGTAVLDSYGLDGEAVYFFASGGADGETTIISATAETNDGETLVETLYLPIRASTLALNNTVLSVLNYALRPIVGVNNTPTAAETEDAREHLDDMLAAWANRGANLGVKLPTAASDVLYVQDGYLSAIKANLRVRICEAYSVPVTGSDLLAARTGYANILFDKLPEERAGVFF